MRKEKMSLRKLNDSAKAESPAPIHSMGTGKPEPCTEFNRSRSAENDYYGYECAL